MALCGDPINGFVTVEYVKLESLKKNEFKFTLKDGEVVLGQAPCIVNFDRK